MSVAVDEQTETQEPEASQVEEIEDRDWEPWSNAGLVLAHFIEGYRVHRIVTFGADSEGLWVHVNTEDRGVTRELVELCHSLEEVQPRMAYFRFDTASFVEVKVEGVYDGHRLRLLTYARDGAVAALTERFPNLSSDPTPVEIEALWAYVEEGS